MIGRTNVQGGKDRLKLRVFGGAAPPSIPRENDIWLLTNVPIRNTELYPYLPAWAGQDGHVYIQTVPATGGDLPNFNATNLTGRDNDIVIWLRLNTAVQRFNGAWVRLNGWIYHGSQWYQFSSAWNGELFDNGNQYEGVTGGWTLSKFSLKDGAFDTGLTSETSGNDVMACTVNKIDVGQFSTLHIQCYSNFSNSGGPGSSRFGICSTNGPSYDNFAAYKDISTGSNNISYYSIDISSVTGAYYVKFYASVAYKMGRLKIEKMWLT